MSPPPVDMDVDMAVRDGPLTYEQLLDEAVNAIQDTLSEEDRVAFRHYADADSMLEDLRKLCAESQKEHQELALCLRRFSRFSHAFAPYFGIMNIYVQVKPGWIGWFWGTVRLAFKAGSAHGLFLSKATELLEVITHVLPKYRHFYDSCRQKFDKTADSGSMILMSYVYADVVQFFLELYHMFSRGHLGTGLRHRIGYSTGILWRPLESRFVKLQQRFVKHKQWFEAEMQPHNEHLAQHRLDLIEYLNYQGDANSEVEEERMTRRLRRVDKIKSWLSGNENQDVYEYARRQRHPGSCSWFLELSEYCQWRNSPFDMVTANSTAALSEYWHQRILFVQANPAFGKTILSSQIIDDLTTEAENIEFSHEPAATVFFHFSSAGPDRSNDAFRALAVQLVHAHRTDRNTLDALSLLMRNTSGQQKASYDNVIAVLSLLLRQHATFLVIDGIDECADIEYFLNVIPELCRHADCRVLLLSRPNIEIPLEYQQWAHGSPHIITLDQSHNTPDIEHYIITNLNRMADQGYFGIGMDRTLIPLIASRADGIFLWAKLLIQYLQSPGLSPPERRITLEQGHRLEGLESLYHSILIMLGRRFGAEKRIAADVFRWLSSSIKPLGTAAIHAALAITPGQPTSEDPHLINFPSSIPRLTCGLVEIRDDHLAFIHHSAKAYLQSEASQDSHFSLYDEATVHAHLAARCISYLTNNVPKRPLQRLQPYRPLASIAHNSGMSFRTNSSADSGYKSMSSSDTEALPGSNSAILAPPFDANMPFLRYASLCWPIHLSRALSYSATSTQPSALPTQPALEAFVNIPWLPALSHFLASRTSVTAWVEASWRYSLPPNLSRLIPLLQDVKSVVPPATLEGRELRWVLNGILQLNEALEGLRDEHGVSVRGNPSLVWQWGGGEGGTGGYWPVWDERRDCLLNGGV